MTVESSRVAACAPTTYEGEAFRHMAAKYTDGLSGEGAKINGGRFNPPDSFPTIYLCTTRPCAVAELQRLGQRQVIGLTGLLPRTLYRYEIDLDRVLDLESEAVLGTVGVDREETIGADWGVPQQIGEAAHATGWQAVRAPSATGVDRVLAIYPENLGSGRITAHIAEEWNQPEDLCN